MESSSSLAATDKKSRVNGFSGEKSVLFCFVLFLFCFYSFIFLLFYHCRKFDASSRLEAKHAENEVLYVDASHLRVTYCLIK